MGQSNRCFIIGQAGALTIISLWMFAVIGFGQNTSTIPLGQGGSESQQEIRIGLLYINTPTGVSHKAGIEEALKERGNSRQSPRLRLISLPYVNQNDGFKLLTQKIRNNEVDIILGPTESDIFVRAIEIKEELSTYQIPVISGLVTAKEGNKEDGWFFRVNVEVTRRVQTIFDFLNKYWIGSIAVIYADTEFGRRAQRAFQKELASSGQNRHFMSLLYEDPPNPREQLRKIIANRFDAVGFFGEREEIVQIYKQLLTMKNSGIPYGPILFTILDIRQIADQMDDVYFVSLTNNKRDASAGESDEWDEVKALGYDLGILVLHVLKDIEAAAKPFTPALRLKFRKQLCTILNRCAHLDGSRTDMAFVCSENTTIPWVFHLKDGEVKPVPLTRVVNWWEKLLHKIGLIFAVYGAWIYISLIVIFIITYLISYTEFRRLFPVKHIKIYKSKIFFLLITGHFIMVITLYIFLSETRRIHYHDILMVMIISITPSALLRTTFFETRYGKAIGLERIYKSLMAWVEEKIMRSRYRELESLTNVIAYNNSEDSIRRALLQIYRNHPSSIKRSKLIQKMEEDMENEPRYLDRRRIGAQLLMRQFTKEELKGEGFVPQNWDYDNPIDPKIIIRKAAKYCARYPEKVKTIDKLLAKQLKLLKKTNRRRYEELQGFMNKELDVVLSVEGRLVVKLRILLVLVGFKIEWFIENNLLKSEDLENEKKRLREEINRQQWRYRLRFLRPKRRKSEQEEQDI